jgi:myxalamid-type polyketide synthase MxaB
VGLAAVQLAQMVGVEIYATASPGKWEFLKGQGIEHVMNSRTLDFADEILRFTGGAGVDVVLNSLSGEACEKSLGVLKPGGRFVEIGKLDILTPEQVRERRPDVSWFTFDFDEVIGREPGLVPSTLGQVRQWFEEGRLRPLPQRVFPMQEVIEAYRYLQQTRHVGKVVLTAEQPAVSIRGDSSYLITGGPGALGLKMAGHLVEQGARHLVLAGRSKATAQAEAAIEALRAAAAAVLVVQADVARAEDVTRLLDVCQRQAPLRGIVHAAGVLDDGIVEKQSAERFARVMAPKVRGAWNLHTQTQGLPLDFFVCFSSMASLLGSVGQSNYAPANAFLDALAHHRRALGLPGLSINWGPWAEVGMAAGLRSRLQGQGEGMIDPAIGVRIFTHALTRGMTQVGVLRVTWSRYKAKYPRADVATLLSALGQTRGPSAPAIESAAPASTMIQRLRSAPVEQRRDLLEEFVRSQVALVLGHRPDAVLRTKGFATLGMDSLAAIELRTRLQQELDCRLPSTLTFDHPTVETLVTYLMDEALTIAVHEVPPSPDAPPAPEDDLAGLAGEDIAVLLARELETLEEGKNV